MTLTVAADLLRDASKTFTEYGDKLDAGVTAALPRCTIPGTSMPTPDMGFSGAYHEALSAVDQGCRGASGVYHAIGQALARVSEHYHDQDAAHAAAFHGQKYQAPSFPGARDLDYSANGADTARTGLAELGLAGGLLGGQTAIGMAITGVTVGVSAAAVVVPVIFVVAAGVAAMACLKDPLPYFDARGGFNDLELILSEAANNLQSIADTVQREGHWSGDGADAFNSFVTGSFKDSMAMLAGLVSELKGTTQMMGITYAIGDIVYIAGAVMTTIGLITAASDPEPVSRLTLGNLVGVGFVAEVVALIGDLTAIAVEAAMSASSLQSATRSLVATFGDTSATLHTNSMALTTNTMDAIQSWEDDGWTYSGKDK